LHVSVLVHELGSVVGLGVNDAAPPWVGSTARPTVGGGLGEGRAPVGGRDRGDWATGEAGYTLSIARRPETEQKIGSGLASGQVVVHPGDSSGESPQVPTLGRPVPPRQVLRPAPRKSHAVSGRRPAARRPARPVSEPRGRLLRGEEGEAGDSSRPGRPELKRPAGDPGAWLQFGLRSFAWCRSMPSMRSSSVNMTRRARSWAGAA
jgi:hypothetical protein